MQLLVAAIIGGSFLSTFPTLASAQCTGVNGAIAAALSRYSFVQNYCSAEYPTQPHTITVFVTEVKEGAKDVYAENVAKIPATVTTTSLITSQIVILKTVTDVAQVALPTTIAKPTTLAIATVRKPCAAANSPEPDVIPGHAPMLGLLMASMDALLGVGCGCIQDTTTITVTSTSTISKVVMATPISNPVEHHGVEGQNVMGFIDAQRPTITVTETVVASATNLVDVKPAAKCESDDDCSGSCFCDARSQALEERICWTARNYCLGGPCQSDFDCPGSQVCAAEGAFSTCMGGSACVETNKCKSSFKE